MRWHFLIVLRFALLNVGAIDEYVSIDLPSYLWEENKKQKCKIELHLVHRWIRTLQPKACLDNSANYVRNVNEQITAEPDWKDSYAFYLPRVPEDSDEHNDVTRDDHV